MTVGWLRNILIKYPDESAEIVVQIGESYYPLAGKIDKVGLAFEDKKSGKARGYEIVVFNIVENPLPVDNLSVDDNGSLN